MCINSQIQAFKKVKIFIFKTFTSDAMKRELMIGCRIHSLRINDKQKYLVKKKVR